MSKSEGYQIIDNLFDEFNQALDLNDYEKIRNILKLIQSAEVHFLNTYHRRKKEGVYYTDSEISKFMFYEILFLLLNKHLKNSFLENIESIFSLDSSNKKDLSNILFNLKICDPACGSGVFLLNAAQIIYDLILKLNPKLEENIIKTQILKNLHGFDINNSAIKLCYLKLFNWFYNEENSDNHQVIAYLHNNLTVENRIISKSNNKYDIILGNPPYGNILNENEKEILKQEETFYNDIYCTFLSKAIDWSEGIVGFLVPKSFLLRQGYVKFRNKFLSRVNVRKIFDIGPNLFKLATNEVQIILYEKKEKNNEVLHIYDFPNNEIIKYNNQKVDSLRICFNSKCSMNEKSKKIYVYTYENVCPYCGSKTFELNRIRIKTTPELYKLIEKIELKGDLNYLNINDFPKMIRGEEDRGLREVKKIVKKDANGKCMFVNAKDDFTYYYIRKNKSFNIEEINPNVLKGKNYEYYTSPKLLIKHNSIIPQTCYSESPICFTSSIYSLLHKDLGELKYINALLNSVLIQFYCIYGINNQKDTTINLNQYMIRHIPIIRPNSQIKTEIIKKTENVINLFETRNGKLDKDIIKILQEIDDFIFNLYSITDKEKKIIISNVKNKLDYFNVIYST